MRVDATKLNAMMDPTSTFMYSMPEDNEQNRLAKIWKHFVSQGGCVNHNAIPLGHDIGSFPSIGSSTYCIQDILVEDVHFSMKYFTPFDLGYRSLAVNLSDLAAGGVQPLGFMISIAVPQRFQKDTFFEEFYSGLAYLSQRYQVPLVGGDLSTSPNLLVVDISVFGGLPNTQQPWTRAGATVGDLVWLTGYPGLSEQGRHELQNTFANTDLAQKHNLQSNIFQNYSTPIQRHLRPTPRTDWVFHVRQNPQIQITSSMDTSDDLLRSLSILSKESKALLEIDLDQIPLHSSLSNGLATSIEAVQNILTGGEDYELLFTSSAESKQLIENLAAKENLNLNCIGVVANQLEGLKALPSVRFRSNHFKNLDFISKKTGWQHFFN
jgi:thiamine-monophosphate kinase